MDKKRNFYVDYLDYSTVSNAMQNFQLERFRFDLLLFADDTLTFSVPACIKLQSTADVLVQLDDYWLNNVFCLQLDKKHKTDPMHYFKNRMHKLEKSISEQKINTHFEYSAYTHKRTESFYKAYLPQLLNKKQIQSLYIDKIYDTDFLFRKEVQNQIHKVSGEEYDQLSKMLSPLEYLKIFGLFNDTLEMAADSSTLFQRALVEDVLQEKHSPQKNTVLIVNDLLDVSFAKANAETSQSYPITFIRNQLTGKWLSWLLSHTYPIAYRAIMEMEWSQLYALASTEEWKQMIKAINALVNLCQTYFMQNSERKVEDISETVKRMTNNIHLYQLFDVINRTAIEKIKGMYYRAGYFNESLFIEPSIKAMEDTFFLTTKEYSAVLYQIDYYAKGIPKIIEMIKKRIDIKQLAEEQKEKKMMLRK